MSKNINMILNAKKVKNDDAREFYLDMRKTIDKNTIDLVKKKGLKPAEINSDMALFKSTVGNKDMMYYYDRIEIKQGGITNVVPL